MSSLSRRARGVAALFPWGLYQLVAGFFDGCGDVLGTKAFAFDDDVARGVVSLDASHTVNFCDFFLDAELAVSAGHAFYVECLSSHTRQDTPQGYMTQVLGNVRRLKRVTCRCNKPAKF